MKKQIVALMLALSPAAFAQPAPQTSPQDPAAWQQMKEQRMAERAQKLAQKLGLDASAAQRFQSAFEDFASRRQALFQQVRSANQTLRAAAKGDQTAGAQVNAAISQLRSARAQLTELQDGLFAQLSNGLNDAQRAKLALVLERQAMHHGHRGGPGHEGARGGARWNQAPAQAP